jgi:2-aminoethylphosphonate-pyruvate transaminase
MSGRPEIAVILAAGRGQRMQTIGLAQPKGFLRLGDLPIVEESVLRLLAAGIRQLVIVTGYLAQQYVDLAKRYPGKLTLVDNPVFASSGSMHSLSLARPHIRGDFLLLDSDLIYEQRALTEILADPAPNVLLVSGKTGSGDEVYVEVRNGLLQDLSKERARLGDNVLGEMVGICRISSDYYKEILRTAQSNSNQVIQMEYEQALVAAARRVPVHCRLIEDLLWSEIDDEIHLARAKQQIYPAIVVRNGPLTPALPQ